MKDFRLINRRAERTIVLWLCKPKIRFCNLKRNIPVMSDNMRELTLDEVAAVSGGDGVEPLPL